MKIAPDPVLGQEPDEAELARKLRQQEAIARVAMGAVKVSGVFFGLVFLVCVGLGVLTSRKPFGTENPIALTCLCGLMGAGFVTAIVGYILGSFAKRVKRGRDAMDAAMASVALFLLSFWVYDKIATAVGRWFPHFRQ